MLINPPISYDLYVCIPISQLLTWHDTSQLRQIRSHHFCAAEQLSVGAGWAGMVWADMFNVPAPTVQN